MNNSLQVNFGLVRTKGICRQQRKCSLTLYQTTPSSNYLEKKGIQKSEQGGKCWVSLLFLFLTMFSTLTKTNTTI